MRRLVVAVLVSMLAVGAGGCGGSSPAHPAGAAPSVGPSTASPSSQSASPQALVDFTPKLVNQPGYPPCGFYAHEQKVNGQSVTYLSLGIAVWPDPLLSDSNPGSPFMSVRYTYDRPGDADDHRETVEFDQTGAVANGSSFTPPGASFSYVSLSVGILPPDAKYLARTTTVTVTVDSEKGVVESNERNNTLMLRVRPTKRGYVKITDNRCTVVR